ncbi:hypothetical protein HF909_10330 [Ralstonia pseudosolanacearum]|uniref:Uncharacterized protein n=1 Tax=Ralstonia solanacearum TaxID=305 RepID=A0AA92K1U1_RALSL|nr:hypothetical protein [Ralstonia pseudosolanacearum]QOK96790.1 hypothetical protein HF909_10330 [Ralstonia pseudosolanacearum]
MEKTDLTQELDRNMDAVFDNLLVLNTAMTAMVQSLDPKTAAGFAQKLDTAMSRMQLLQNRPGPAAWQQLHAWRNQAGSLAGLPVRQPG